MRRKSSDTPLRLAVTLAVFLGACATVPPEIPDSPVLTECRAHFLALDEITGDDGVRNGGAYRIPGFPYLRSNRFLASFRGGLYGEPQFAEWVEQLRRLSLVSREPELRNLGQPQSEEELEQLDRCGKTWAVHDLADPKRRAELLKNVAVPDDYSTAKRLLGLYAFAVPFLKLGIGGYQDEVREDFTHPVEALQSPGPMTLWQPETRQKVSSQAVAQWLLNASQNPLGIPPLSDEQWWRLAATHAPEWWVETGGAFDHPGALKFENGEPSLDLKKPVTYFLPSYTRFGGRVLPQLVYVIWFSERPKAGLIDSYAGKLDGLVWRVTLGTDGQPLLYDTIHPCGCYHYFFPVKVMKRRPQDDFWQEPVMFPQESVPAGRPAIRVQSATHFVRRVITPESAISSENRTYRLRDYRELLSLPDGEPRTNKLAPDEPVGAEFVRSERTRSLFCGDGLVCGTERFERFWLWPAGVESAGAMRQWGRHATAFVGRRHFDEPYLLEKLFVAP